MRMRMPAPASRPVKAMLVNWQPWSEDLGLAEAGQRLVQRVDAERDVHRVRQPPVQNRPARPVEDRDQVEEAAADRDVGDVRRPHLVRPVDYQVAQEVRVNLVARRVAYNGPIEGIGEARTCKPTS
jgi:hypothetical protein